MAQNLKGVRARKKLECVSFWIFELKGAIKRKKKAGMIEKRNV